MALVAHGAAARTAASYLPPCAPATRGVRGGGAAAAAESWSEAAVTEGTCHSNFRSSQGISAQQEVFSTWERFLKTMEK